LALKIQQRKNCCGLMPSLEDCGPECGFGMGCWWKNHFPVCEIDSYLVVVKMKKKARQCREEKRNYNFLEALLCPSTGQWQNLNIIVCLLKEIWQRNTASPESQTLMH